MTITLIWLAGIALGAVTGIALAFFASSIAERERRAAWFGGVQFLLLLGMTIAYAALALAGFFNQGVGFWLLITGCACGLAVFLLLWLPIGRNPVALRGTAGLIRGEVRQADERDTVFSGLKIAKAARLLPPGEATAASGAAAVTDEFINSLAQGTLSGSSLPHKGLIDAPNEGVVAAMVNACAEAAVALDRPELLEPPVAEQQLALSPAEAALRVKGFARHIGAKLVGITELDPQWLYSHSGVSRLDEQAWGSRVETRHRYAIVFAVEMDSDLVGTGPHSPAVLDTMHNYARIAFIGTELAGFIARLGYSAKANQMEHYDGLMVPLAVDAGLGELSRMGYLVTREYGPRVRLNIVTTDLPLTTDQPVDIGVVDFCNICKKCAHCCPSQSIPVGEPVEHNGLLRWKLDADSCLKYWQRVGTDCAVCMRVCPWSHARTLPHRLIVALVSRNALSRRLFTWLDDLYYGRRPARKAPPAWASCGKPDSDG